MGKLNVRLNENYMLTADALNFIVKVRKVVDPTKAPGYKAVANAPAPEFSEKWTDDGYYPLTTQGLAAAFDVVRMKTVATADINSLGDMGMLIRAESEKIAAALASATGGSISVRMT